jgi:hypothetical protein
MDYSLNTKRKLSQGTFQTDAVGLNNSHWCEAAPSPAAFFLDTEDDRSFSSSSGINSVKLPRLLKPALSPAGYVFYTCFGAGLPTGYSYPYSLFMEYKDSQ